MTACPGRILTGSAADCNGERNGLLISLHEGRIHSVEAVSESTKPAAGDLDARDALIVPGFIDLHVHGGSGRSIMEGTPDALDAVSHHLARYGVTGFLATTVTAPIGEMEEAAKLIGAAYASSGNGRTGARVLGCHQEGPFINPEKRGAQPEAFIRPPDLADLDRLLGPLLGVVKIMTIAPEMPGALEVCRALVRKGVIPSIGHTNATYAEVLRGIEAGACHVTHCYNAMRQLGSREPGVVGAALSHRELTAELIWDNIHVHPASCDALVLAKRPDRVVLISDGIPGCGMPDGYSFSLGDLPVLVADGAARLPDGVLAGSLLTLDRAFAHARRHGLQAATRMSSWNAAAALGLERRKGLIAAGYDADLVVLDSDGKVRTTLVAGRIVYGE